MDSMPEGANDTTGVGLVVVGVDAGVECFDCGEGLGGGCLWKNVLDEDGGDARRGGGDNGNACPR